MANGTVIAVFDVYDDFMHYSNGVYQAIKLNIKINIKISLANEFICL